MAFNAEKKPCVSVISWRYIALVLPCRYHTLSSFCTRSYCQAIRKCWVFGDQYGATNALISGFAFAGLLATIWQQRQDLALQREEINETQQLHQQQLFETSFFNLLNLRERVVSDLVREGKYDPNPTRPAQGRELVKDVANTLYRHLECDGANLACVSEEYLLRRYGEIDSEYQRVMNAGESGNVSEYVRVSLNIIGYIGKAHFGKPDIKSHYLKIYRDMITLPELKLLYYACLSNQYLDSAHSTVSRLGFFDDLGTEDYACVLDIAFTRTKLCKSLWRKCPAIAVLHERATITNNMSGALSEIAEHVAMMSEDDEGQA